jgi:polar amino acid transport system permease protein
VNQFDRVIADRFYHQEIMGYSFQFSIVWDNIGLLLTGAWLTLKISLLAISFGLIIGIIGAIFRTSHNKLLDTIALAYVEIIRNTPYLIQLFFIFFGMPNLGIKLTAEQAAILSLAVNFGAYSTEIVRAGVESIHHGQVEAGMALGFKPLSIFRHIILLPALANIYPALVGQVILAVLFTSVVSQIATEDLTFVGDFLNARSFRSFEIYFAISLIYLAIVWLIKAMAFAIDRRFFEFAKYRR